MLVGFAGHPVPIDLHCAEGRALLGFVPPVCSRASNFGSIPRCAVCAAFPQQLGFNAQKTTLMPCQRFQRQRVCLRGAALMIAVHMWG